MWVVDTCVIIDVLDRISGFAEVSAAALDAKYDDGLTIAPVTFVELAPAFNADLEEQIRFLTTLGIDIAFDENRETVFHAYKGWYSHILRKRASMERKRPVADVLIGAYALSKGGLITRNEADFRALFPELVICNPAR